MTRSLDPWTDRISRSGSREPTARIVWPMSTVCVRVCVANTKSRGTGSRADVSEKLRYGGVLVPHVLTTAPAGEFTQPTRCVTVANVSDDVDEYSLVIIRSAIPLPRSPTHTPHAHTLRAQTKPRPFTRPVTRSWHTMSPGFLRNSCLQENGMYVDIRFC